MKQGLTEIVLVLDRSGSMATTRSDAEGGLRAFVTGQRAVPGDAVVTFYRFDNVIERVFDAKPLRDILDSELKLEPRGSTALLDAMLRAITEVGQRLAATPEDQRPEKVYFVTITDGYENSSEAERKDVFAAVTEQRDKYKWEFVFIGADQDAIAEAARLGIQYSSTISYKGSKIGTQNAYAVMTSNIARSRVGGQSVNFSDADRALVMDQTPSTAK